VVGVDHQTDPVADLGPHAPRCRNIVREPEPHLQLHSGEALGHVSGGLLPQIRLVVVTLAPVEAGGVGLHLRADRPAHEDVDRYAERAPLQVPQCDVDAAQRLYRKPFLAVIAEAGVQILPDRLGRKRVAPDEPLAVDRHDRRVHAGRPVNLAPPGKPVLGHDLDDERPALVVPGPRIGERRPEFCAQQVGLDRFNLHDELRPTTG
jgi:hypothetical protein